MLIRVIPLFVDLKESLKCIRDYYRFHSGFRILVLVMLSQIFVKTEHVIGGLNTFVFWEIANKHTECRIVGCIAIFIQECPFSVACCCSIRRKQFVGFRQIFRLLVYIIYYTWNQIVVIILYANPFKAFMTSTKHIVILLRKNRVCFQIFFNQRFVFSFYGIPILRKRYVLIIILWNKVQRQAFRFFLYLGNYFNQVLFCPCKASHSIIQISGFAHLNLVFVPFFMLESSDVTIIGYPFIFLFIFDDFRFSFLVEN